MPIDREAYDALLKCEDTLQQHIGNHPSGLMSVALLAVREARRELTPVVTASTATSAKAEYPKCGPECRASGQWGGSGRMPAGHVLVRWKNGMYLAHDGATS